MIKHKDLSTHNSLLITKPPGASLQHAFDSLLSLRLPRPEGFSPTPGKAHLSLFVLEPNALLGPIGYSTDTRRLFCYKSVFQDGAMAVLIITGDSLSCTLRERSLQNALTRVQREAIARDGIEKHTLCAVRTPLALHIMMDVARHVQSQAVLQSMIQNTLSDRAGGLGALDMKMIDLNGWSHRSSSLPQCYVSRDESSPKDLTMKFEWARGERHYAAVRF